MKINSIVSFCVKSHMEEVDSIGSVECGKKRNRSQSNIQSDGGGRQILQRGRIATKTKVRSFWSSYDYDISLGINLHSQQCIARCQCRIGQKVWRC